MQNIEIKILRYIDERREWKTSEMLSAHFGVSVRKIKYCISKINTNDTLIISSRKGYISNPEKQEQINKIIMENKDSIYPEDMNRRTEFLIKTLLTKDDGIHLFDFSEELYVNSTTIRNDILRLKQILSKYNLEIKAKNNVYRIIGEEKNKRRIMTFTISQEASRGFILNNALKEMFMEDEIHEIKRILRGTFDNCKLYINDYAFMNILIHLIVVIERNKKGYLLMPSSHAPHVDEGTYKFSLQVFYQIEVLYELKFTSEEIHDFAILIESQIHIYDKEIISDVKELVSSDIYELVNEIINAVKKEYYVDLSDSSFTIKFALHIKNLLFRMKIDSYSNNPYVEYIKSSCPLIYEVCVFIANIIYKKMGIRINDNEIGFLALHIGSMFDQNIKIDHQVQAILICPSYYDIAMEIKKKTEESSHGYLCIIEIVSDESEVTKSMLSCDIIISTIPLLFHYEQEIIFLTPIINDSERANIVKSVQRIYTMKEANRLKESFLYVFHESLFLKSEVMDDYQIIVNKMCEKMQELDYVENDYAKKVWEREKMSPTVYGKVAIPHTLKASAKRSGISIYLNEKSIDWNGKVVYIILVIAIHPKDQVLFNELFNKITEVLSSEQSVLKVMKSTSSNEFIELLYSQLVQPF